ncbi:MAG: ABC transporter ATP-binding protein [Desulfobacteraceae bacterium]
MDSAHNHEKDTIPLFKAEKIRKSFFSSEERIDILKDINLSLNHGETLGIIGASGIGKSTLLHILGTLDRPDDGFLWFKGENIFALDDTKLAKFRNQSIGFVFQFHHLLPEFSALENTMMPALINGISPKEANIAAEKILVRVGLKDRLQHRANELSGGEQQRVALARALALKPLLLLADEPTGNLDQAHGDKIHDLLLELNTEIGMTLIIVTHNMELATLMSRQVTINNGKLVETK